MKDQVIQELKEKLKRGIKPSDLKKNMEGVLHDFNLPPSDERSPSGFDKPDEGYESDGSVKTTPTKTPLKKDQISQLQAQVKFESQKAQSYPTELQSTLAELDQAQQEIAQFQKRLKTKPETVSQVAEQALIEANQKIRQLTKTNEELQTKNQSLNKSIVELKTQVKIPAKTKATPELFTCSHCLQEWSPEFIRLIDQQGNKTCLECVENMLELTKQATGQEIIIEKQTKLQPTKPCQFCSKPYPQSQLKPRHIKNLPHKDPREITWICQACLTYRAIKADLVCPRISSGRDTYEGAEFDCFCPTERRTY